MTTKPNNFPETFFEDLGDDQRDARVRLLSKLIDQGYDLDQLEQAAKEQRLVLLPVEAQLRSGTTLTTGEVIEITSVDRNLLLKSLEAANIDPFPADPHFWREGEIVFAEFIRDLHANGVHENAILDTCRSVSELVNQTVLTLAVEIASSLTQAGDSEDLFAARTEQVMGSVTWQLTGALGLFFRQHLLSMFAAVNIDPDRVSTGKIAQTAFVTIAFADVVGYTKLGEQIGPEALTDVAVQLEELTNEAVAGTQVRVVKSIGDAVMLSSWDPTQMIDVMLRLQDLAKEREFQQIRVGIASGDASPRKGDWFGPTVNRASRICSAALPSTTLADSSTRELVDRADLDWRFIGKHNLKGLGRIAVNRLKRRSVNDEREQKQLDKAQPEAEAAQNDLAADSV